MGLRFDPSSNKYTDSAVSIMSNLALAEHKLGQKKKQATEMIKELKKSGGLGEDFEISGYNLETGIPKIGKKGGYKPKTREDAISFAKDKHDAIYGGDDDEEYAGPTDPALNKPRIAAPRGRSMLNTLNPLAVKDKMPFILNPATAMDFYKKKFAARAGGAQAPAGAGARPSLAPRAPAVAPAQAPAQAPAPAQAQQEYELPPEIKGLKNCKLFDDKEK